ncbi:hypothetical protein S1OALGB6SA_1392 [Olavius algarvensis spirochete endosymbiont]|uniref:tetratricopeptide repeat protein n=1 Tax=Olavius algarvensis spirochete endosymbiont TaxID=260710 RepID=UPI0006920F42|nr:hypothetical protein [Olavius algarvensis spirochete endosymbiont]VDB00314.1 hypothetical protein S1OALGB6SA_1392 [Olavius algarvensis spirochete endosymbiont]
MLVDKDDELNIDDLITKGYRLFETGHFVEARKFLDAAHSLNYENPEVKTALRACGYWRQRQQNLETIYDDVAKGDYLYRQWKHYTGKYQTDFEHPLDEGSACIKKWVHTEALSYYRKQAFGTSDIEAFFQAGRCQKALGNYEECISMLKEAVGLSGGSDSRSLAELADAYALIGESQWAKVLLREALFLNASVIELDEIISPLFRRLIDRLSKEIESENLNFSEWLPVYGAIWGVLDVKRELSAVEYGKLKRSIYALKSEIAISNEREAVLAPKLINHFLRLIDHYQITGTNHEAIDDVLVNIKLLSPAIYRNYFEHS